MFDFVVQDCLIQSSAKLEGTTCTVLVNTINIPPLIQ